MQADMEKSQIECGDGSVWWSSCVYGTVDFLASSPWQNLLLNNPLHQITSPSGILASYNIVYTPVA